MHCCLPLCLTKPCLSAWTVCFLDGTVLLLDSDLGALAAAFVYHDCDRHSRIHYTGAAMQNTAGSKASSWRPTASSSMSFAKYVLEEVDWTSPPAWHPSIERSARPAGGRQGTTPPPAFHSALPGPSRPRDLGRAQVTANKSLFIIFTDSRKL